MNKEIEYWKWKNTIMDFNAISDEKIDCNSWYTKKDWIFQYLGCPDERIHEWYNGGFSCEYNNALRYAKEFGLVEDYIDYEDEIYNLKQKNEKLNHYKLLYQKVKDRNDKAIEFIESKNNGMCIVNGEEKGAYTFLLDFDKSREFIWNLLDILKGESNE